MKKLSITLRQPPASQEEVKMLEVLLLEVNACFIAFSLDCDVPVMDDILHAINASTVGGMNRKQFVTKVADCNRTVAFISFIRNAVTADITFCKGGWVVETIAIMFDGDTGQIRVL